MNKNNALLTLGVVVAALVATWLWMDLRQQRTQGSELAGRIAALESATAPSAETTQPAGVATDMATAPAPLPPPVPMAAAKPASGSASTSAGAEPAEQTTAQQSPAAAILGTMQTPQGQDFMASMMRGLMGQMYPDVGEELDLSEQEVDALFDLLARQQQEVTNDGMGLLTGSVQDPEARREIQRKMADKQRAQKAELEAHLGPKYAKWDDYRATASAKQQVNTLKTSLAAAGKGLSEEQEGKLVAAFSTEQKRLLKDEEDWALSPGAIDSPNMMQESVQRALAAQRRLLDVAKPHLTADQTAQFQQQVDQQAGMLQAVMGMMGGQGTPGQAPAGAPGAR